jgi:hypothetical protein
MAQVDAVGKQNVVAGQSMPKPSSSNSCDNWTLDYTMIHGSGGWLINAVNSRVGLPAYSSCT